MVKQLKDLCVKAERGRNLAECLNGYTKPQIKKILDFYGKKTGSAAKKQEMIDAAEEAIKESAAAYLESGEGDADKQLLNEIIAEPVRVSDLEEFRKLESLHERGLIFLTEAEGAAEAIVPANIVAIADSMNYGGKTSKSGEKAQREPKAAVSDRSGQEAEIIRYAASLSNIYGLFSFAQLKDVWDMNHHRSISPSELRSAVEKAGDEDGFYVKGDLLINGILDEDDCKEIIGKYSIGDTYYYPSAEVIDAYADGPRMKDAPEYVYLQSYLSRKTSAEAADDILLRLFRLALKDASASDLVEYLQQAGINFLDLDELNRFLLLYTGWFYDIRVWACKGYKPGELKQEKLQMRNFNLSPDFDPRSRRKVGRNDGCPCGSGKKYKSCCMKRVQTGE